MNTHINSRRGHRFSREIISHGVWLYHRFSLSLRDVEELLAKRGITVTQESIRQWCRKLGPEYARRLKRGQGRLGDAWHLDEVFVKIGGMSGFLFLCPRCTFCRRRAPAGRRRTFLRAGLPAWENFK